MAEANQSGSLLDNLVGQRVEGADPVIEAGQQAPLSHETVYPAAEVVHGGVDQGHDQNFLLITHALHQL